GHQGSVVIDADALHALAAHNHIKKPAKATWIMTPHSGEFARLSKNNGSILEQCVEYAQERQTILVLKGSPAIVATPAGETYLSPNTTRAMATAGTGDVLAGMIAGFLAQGMDPIDAALCALLGGELAARRYCTTRCFRSMVATDIIAQLPYVLRNESAD
ncbi:MAG: NAD(P)H-hydrate dehydratase, partial [Rhodothermales bacterium]|nr:NAD(P)H-hydrate dehydratase [Rhodothermales bacterium]